ncbi:MAG TPA: response regulator [Bacteroidales bacterium]|nr:response regulator [Bacteroidales bacterium]
MAKERTVLVCEDNKSTYMLLERALKGIGYHVLIDPTGDKAFDFINNHNLDLIITDLNMPSVSGFEIIEYARKKKVSKIPIIVLTNMIFSETYDQAMELGADVFLTKPFDLHDFTETVKSLEDTD